MEDKPLNKHQIRSQLSRQKVIDAFIECVNESGLSSATVARIAEKAGVTWGVLQHQFGDKHSILAAVISAWAADFSAALDDIDTGGKDLEAAVEELVAVFWSFCSKPIYRTALEILLNTERRSNRSTIATTDVAAQQRQVMYQCWYENIKKTSCPSSDATIMKAGELMFTALSGYAIRRAVRPEEGPSLEPQRAFLVKALVAMLSEEGASRPR